MAAGATTCHKTKTCSEGGYYDSEPEGQKCTSFNYNGNTCYKDCEKKGCPDGWFEGTGPQNQNAFAYKTTSVSGTQCYGDVRCNQNNGYENSQGNYNIPAGIKIDVFDEKSQTRCYPTPIDWNITAKGDWYSNIYGTSGTAWMFITNCFMEHDMPQLIGITIGGDSLIVNATVSAYNTCGKDVIVDSKFTMGIQFTQAEKWIEYDGKRYKHKDIFVDPRGKIYRIMFDDSWNFGGT